MLFLDLYLHYVENNILEAKREMLLVLMALNIERKKKNQKGEVTTVEQ